MALLISLSAAYMQSLVLLLHLSVLATMIVPASSAPVSADQPDSAQILLEVKALLIDPTGSLRSWAQERTSTLCEDWHGVACDNTSSSVQIVGIHLPYKNLSGSLSPAIGSLSSLRALNMSSNMLTGVIPTEITSCRSLRSLDLSNNNFTGELPVGLSQLAHLETLSLWTNSFVGPIPHDIVLCSQLKHLDLGGSYLDGEIPHAIANLTNLVYLTLAGNEFTGEIPPSLGQLRRLEWIYLGYNRLTGSIPPQLGEISTLNHLDLVHNNLTGELPYSLTNLTNLEYLFLYDNQLTGAIPPAIANLTKLFSLDLSSNMMTGSIPGGISSLGQLLILNLFSNELSGEIPHSLAEMRSLQVLALWMNKLTGEVPAELGSRNNFTLLDLSSNELRGRIPEHLCASNNLHNLILFSNFMSGPIPQSLAECRSLRRVRMEGNQFSGSIPATLATLPHVYYLDLSSNQFTGSLDSLAWNMPSLQVLNLQANRFSGSIPPSLQNSKGLETLDLSQNVLAGGIPLELGSLDKLNKLYLSGNALSGTIEKGGFLMCKQLAHLNLSNNDLTGPIPTGLAGLMSLSSLDLSHNQFSGAIPPQLGDLDSLVSINLSFNRLSGEVPRSGVFIQINASSIEGNPGLCGITGSLGRCPDSGGHGSIQARITAVLFLIGLMISLVGIGNVIWKFKHNTRSEQTMRGKEKISMSPAKPPMKAKPWAGGGEWSLTLFQTVVRPSVEEILEAMQEENVLEKGNASSSYLLYKGSTEGGIRFAAMELIASSCDDHQGKDAAYGSEHVPLRAVLGTLAKSRISSPNLVDVYGVCSGMASSILVLELVHQGCTLRSLMLQHGSASNPRLGAVFHMERRLKVAIDIAKAIMHLHSCCSPPIVHGSISCDTVIVDSEFMARLLPPSTSRACLIDTETRLSAVHGHKLAADTEASGAEEEDTQETDAFAADVRAFGEVLVELARGMEGTVGADTEKQQLAESPSSRAGAVAYKLVEERLGSTVGAGAVPDQQWKQHQQQQGVWSASEYAGNRAESDGWSPAAARESEKLGRELMRRTWATRAALGQGLRLLQGIWRRRHASARSASGGGGSGATKLHAIHVAAAHGTMVGGTGDSEEEVVEILVK